jgi:hypothetical protein
MEFKFRLTESSAQSRWPRPPAPPARKVGGLKARG